MMSEFKAQILGILLVLTVFALMNNQVAELFTGVWSTISDRISAQLA